MEQMTKETPKMEFHIEGILSAICLIFVVFVIILQVLSRLAPVPSPAWTGELSRWLWIWLIAFALGAVERSNNHLKMTFFVQKLGLKTQTIISFLTDIVVIIVLFDILIHSKMQLLLSLRSTAVTLPWPRFIIYIAFPIGFISVIMYTGIRLKKYFKVLKN